MIYMYNVMYNNYACVYLAVSCVHTNVLILM